jgi:hypothetical protein
VAAKVKDKIDGDNDVDRRIAEDAANKWRESQQGGGAGDGDGEHPLRTGDDVRKPTTTWQFDGVNWFLTSDWTGRIWRFDTTNGQFRWILYG